MGAGRPTKYKEEYNEHAYKLCLLGYIDEDLAKFFEVDVSTINNWKIEYPKFFESIKSGKEVADANVAESLYKRANGFRYKEVTQELISDDTQKARHEGKVELTVKQWEISKNYFNNKCAYCGSDDKLTKEHIIPFKKNGEFKMENIIPACTSCNCSKQEKDLEEWYKNISFYDEYKLRKIYDYIEFAKNVSEKSESKLTITKIVEKEQAPDTGAAMAWLKNRQSKKWRKFDEDKLTFEQKMALEKLELEKRKLALLESQALGSDDDFEYVFEDEENEKNN